MRPLRPSMTFSDLQVETPSGPALQDANAEIFVLTEEEGGSITHGCQFFSSPFVSITNLTKSDSGWYRCGVHNILNSYEDFVIRVKDAPVASTPNWTPGALSPSVPSASSLTTAQSLSSSSGSSAPPSASPEASEQPEQQQTSAEGPGVLLYVGLTLLVMVGAFSAVVLIACRKSARKPKDPPVEAERMNAIESSRVYEEIQEENRRSGPPPGEISPLYSQATFPKLNAAEATDEYSLVTAATSQTTPEEESSKLTYSQLDFAASSLSGAPCGDAESVVYSAPRLQDASPPLYSTVTSHPL
ncbi:uncharacterized protein LOC143327040 [Chaetodon auriga]|uniref:uncharacterized protein LOC143327040 n=1 Tax=Chaetodon auriga TaxID=39042 RepID=UPI004032E5F6